VQRLENLSQDMLDNIRRQTCSIPLLLFHIAASKESEEILQVIDTALSSENLFIALTVSQIKSDSTPIAKALSSAGITKPGQR
jgi:hypothetical protein